MIEKRGQITLFMIVGIVLVIALILVLVIRYRTTIAQYVPEGLLPAQTGGVERFIEDCTVIVARDGLSLLAAQGGYIYLPEEIQYHPRATIDTGLKVPLWHYFSDNRIPSESLMESHLGRYVDEQLKSCLNGLAVFQDEYTIVEKASISTKVTIGKNQLFFEVTYPLEIVDKEGLKIAEVTTYVVDVPILLRDMREVGVSIMEREAAELKFERLTIDLLALDSDIPTAGTDISCDKKTWKKDVVGKKLQTLLRTNLPSLRVANTDFIAIPDNLPYLQNHYVWKITDNQYDDISVGFRYVETPFSLEVQPRSGNTLKSNQLKGQELASFVCLQQWNFVYDVEYPVLVTVEDQNNNFALNFGFLVHVNDNRGNRAAVPNRALEFAVEGSEERYCENVYGGYNMRFFTYDNVSSPLFGESYEPIDDVELAFTCLKYTCKLGLSEYIDGGARAVYGTAMPYCVNGILRATKEGYKPAQKFMTTRDEDVSIYLTPLKVINEYTVVKHVESNDVLLGSRPLDSDEQAFISLKYRMNGTIHETWGTYPAAKDTELQPLELLAGATYPISAEIYVMKENDIVGGFVGAWTAEWSELKDADTIEFHVVAQNAASDAQVLAFIAKLDQYSKDELLQPVMR